ncbi:hypothetical protein TRFO_39900 [Tritrichomonas foetus]|uniref:Biogenesis of lysosome-related organelles complex 1 subunit 5 n=1 Tax=Tritrichomonas foetus TaxID=1144522 RepID=A0A1J4J9L3_9EUKA|nr:hypothetical protein TRFO_39900 [Tritrichomonas foetus]|eukprot:OHS93932.1 hypothetical protein TRFO_39900 [Tritrichomonas foetus]
MGQDESQANAEVQKKEVNVEEKVEIDDDLPKIPEIKPLISQIDSQTLFPDDYSIPFRNLPDAHQLIHQYNHDLSFHINRNEEAIAFHIKRQKEHFENASLSIHNKKSELESSLAQVLSGFRNLDDEIKNTTDSLEALIKKADELAALIDPTLPSFSKIDDSFFKKRK